MEEEENLTPMSELTILSQTLLNELKCLPEGSNEERIDLLRKHLISITEQASKYGSISFPSEQFDWFNVEAPLRFKEDLRGYVVVLDFFTYCCINCMHILPDLEKLEQIHPPNASPVLVVGVHSAKFENEKISDSVSDAIRRYNISHPVINDVKCHLWQKLEISCWPTLLIVSPDGVPLFVLMGEGNAKYLQELVDASVKYFSSLGKLTKRNLPLLPQCFWSLSKDCSLSYPGKISVYEDGLIISDSGNNRIVIVDWEGNVKMRVGCGKRGLRNGSFEEAEFNNPQGTVFAHPDTIYVADTNNHAIRKINIKKKTVDTIAGNGSQGVDKEGGLLWTEQAVCSPWDLCLAHSLDLNEKDPANLLIVAMAGSHQIWGVFLTDGTWLKKSFYPKGSVVCLAGTGVEESRNTSYPLKAGFAQPSGIDVGTVSGKETVFIADAESSSVREFSLSDGSVRRAIGGSIDPTNLFAFGDADGTGTDAKLQHPLAVAVGGRNIYVADTYNHKIKVLTKEGKSYHSSTIHSTETNQFNEPSGLAVDESNERLFIADTNNHAIKVLSLDLGIVSDFPVKWRKEEEEELEEILEEDTVDSRGAAPDELCFGFPLGTYERRLKIDLRVPRGTEVNRRAKNGFKILPMGDTLEAVPSDADIQDEIKLLFTISDKDEVSFVIKCQLYLCLDSGICTMCEMVKNVTLFHDEGVKAIDSIIICFSPEIENKL